MTITAAQVKAARALLGWSRVKLAVAANIGPGRIAEFESGARAPSAAELEDFSTTFEAAGVIFAGAGVRLMKGK